MSTKLLIIGSDKISRKCVFKLNRQGVDLNKIHIVVDKSTNMRRLFSLVMHGKISIECLFKMVSADFKRKNYPDFNFKSEIYSNNELYNILKNTPYHSTYLFRAGLIINKTLLSRGFRFLNVHCASIPEYAGLCSIYKAIKDEAFNQKACMHTVTTTIDDPYEIVDYEPYKLNPMKSYFINEETAYDAGIRLLSRAFLND